MFSAGAGSDRRQRHRRRATTVDYSINMDYLIGGGSAGAITSVGVSVTEPSDFRDELSELEILTTNLDQEYAVRTILDFCSPTSVNLLQGVYDVERFDSNDPRLFINGTADSTDLLKCIVVAGHLGIHWGALCVLLFGDATVVDANGAQTLYELAFDFVVSQQGLVVE